MVTEVPSSTSITEPATKVQKMSVDKKPTETPKSESKTIERLPSGAKAAFSDFKFPQESTSTEK